MNSQEEKDFTLREDVLLFNDALTQSGHNIKNYRKRRQELAKRSDKLLPASTECTQPQLNNFIWTIQTSQHTPNHDSEEKMKLNLDRLTMRRKSVTAGGSRKRSSEAVKTQARTLYVGNARENIITAKNNSLGRENKYKSIQKEHNKGPFKQKYLEAWLNALLLEACHEQTFDMTIENPGLKKFQLDRNSLLSKGIKISNLCRLYKSLFVYSVGFNDLLNEICNKNMQLRKSIWKVYVILLEYCAEGSFEMMIAEIERDKTRKVEGLRQEIEKRQWIIENNEEINQEKNAKIYKEIKYLKQENQSLLNQKQILLEEFKQAQQAFNQEVSLRLKFENRINEIHGVYTEIKVKHERLILDFEKNKQEIGELRAAKTEMTTAIIELKADNKKKSEELTKTQKQLKYQQELVGQLEIRKQNDTAECITLKNKIKDMKKMLQEKQREIGQKQCNYQNISLLFQTEKQEHALKGKQFLASIDQNSRLHRTIQEQMKQLNALYLETRNFGTKTSQIKAQAIIAGRKLAETTQKLRETEQRERQQENQKKKMDMMHEKEKKHREQLEMDLEKCYQQIKEMRQAKNYIEQALESNMKKINIIDEIIDAKDLQIAKRNDKIYELEETNAQNLNLLKTSESKLKMLREKMTSDQEMNDKKLASLKEQKQKISTLYEQFDNLKRQLQLQLEKYKQLYEDTHLNLKNQLFERSNLDILYKQSLNVMEHENNHIKQLNIEKSELNEQIFSLKRKIKHMEYVNTQKDKQFLQDKSFWEREIHDLAVFNREKKQYVHPMVFEDVAANYASTHARYVELTKKYTQEGEALRISLKNAQNQIKQLKAQYSKEVKGLQSKYMNLIDKKDNEIAYQQERRTYFLNKNKELEESLNRITSGKLVLTNESEQKYLARIKQQTNKIADLAQQVESAHDQNAKLREQYCMLSESLPRKQQEMEEMREMLEVVKVRLNEQIKRNETVKQTNTARQQIQAVETPASKEPKEIKERQASGKSEKKERKSEPKYETINWKDKKQRVLQGAQDDKRSDFARKYKGAFSYYHK